ncbi:MAG: hypothetical protein J6U54_02020 [Clostridiales bacterium]|nr:hypothetical protein [Clostridiales bacterium]
MNTDYREPSVIELIDRLKEISEYNGIAFGQQNAGHIGISIKNNDGTESDVKNLCGSHPLVVGIDTLSFYGYEGNYHDLVRIVQQLHKEGVIITLSSHMPNFSLGGDDYFDFSSKFTDGDIGHRIMPGGDLNSKYIRFLNKIAEFASDCIDVHGERIPMIFRPFHEDNGNWFWWGREYLGDKDFVNLFKYTIDYLRNDCGIRSFLYCYSPNGAVSSVIDYLGRYPGDDYVDIMGLDYYDDTVGKKDKFFDELSSSLKVVAKCARNHCKLYALTETGVRVLDNSHDGKYYGGLAPSGNVDLKWFTELLDLITGDPDLRGIAYALIWANFSDTQFWAPYVKDDFRHEMVDDFLKFLNDERTILADSKKSC